MGIWLQTLIAVSLVSLLSLVGIASLAIGRKRFQSLLFFLVSFAVGGLFGDAFIHLIPESFRVESTRAWASAYILSGILLFFILEKFIRWRHCHASTEEHSHPVVSMNIIGDAAHNLIDGMLIGASFSVKPEIGIATTLAIILHEIPHEMGNFGILIHCGLTVKKALLYNFLSTLSAIFGALITLGIGHSVHGFTQALIPITAGGFIYIAGSDLIPELHHDVGVRRSLAQLICIFVGVGIMALLLMME